MTIRTYRVTDLAAHETPDGAGLSDARTVTVTAHAGTEAWPCGLRLGRLPLIAGICQMLQFRWNWLGRRGRYLIVICRIESKAVGGLHDFGCTTVVIQGTADGVVAQRALYTALSYTRTHDPTSWR